MSDTLPTPPVPAWLRLWAILTALCALPLVTLGAEVTTKNVGLVDDKGFRAPWHLFTVAFQDRGIGYLIEHGHRLFGFVVGLCCIVLALGMTFQARGWYRALGWLALVAVGVQGLLGIFRVDLHSLFGTGLATIHGCFAQLVFAGLVGVAVISSPAWWGARSSPDRSLARAGLCLCLLVYVQIVFGAVVRHLLDPVAQRLHILLAFAVVVTVWWLALRLRRDGTDPVSRRACHLLVILVTLQPVLGIEAWIRRFGSATIPQMVPSSLGLDLARSGHHVLGTLIFSTTVALLLLLHRPVSATAAVQPAPRPLEAA